MMRINALPRGHGNPVRAASARRCGGYTLTELMVAMGIFAIMMTAATGMFITMLRMYSSVSGSTSAALDAANAIQHVTGDLRQARGFQLMDGGAFGDTYDARDGSGNYIAVTGIRITFPAANSAVAVVTSAGGSAIALRGGDALWDRKNDGQTLSFYRANVNGAPNPNTGTCLWVSGIENGQAISRAVIKSIAPELDAVQFIQPYMPDGVTPIPNEVKVKITSAYYDRRHGFSSSDTAGGGVTQLTGECAYLRDHNPFGATSNGAHGRTQD